VREPSFMNLIFTTLDSTRTGLLPVEIVERKGVGHPDTICDALAENLSVALSRFYQDRFGFILHHNVDKGLLCGGAARAWFGGGEVHKPIDLMLAGRATEEFSGVKVPLQEIAVESAREWLRQHLRHLDAERQVRIHCMIRPSSADLVDLFERQRGSRVPLANDTSLGVGYAPLDALERAVTEIEAELNSPQVKATHPEIGEDIKVMGVRVGGHTGITVACAFVARHVAGMVEYAEKKDRVRRIALRTARHIAGENVAVHVNSADGASPESIYLTVTGTSAEAGDDGQVGRGNRVNGLITPYRAMSIEATAGKNPVSHVGKLYNVAARRMAQALIAGVPGIEEAACCLVSRIGEPIDEPQALDVKLRLREGVILGDVQKAATGIAVERVREIPLLWQELLAGREQLF